MAIDPTWWPVTADVAAILRTRTRTQGIEGDFGGTPASGVGEDFSATSSPTKTQVERLIRMAALDFRSMSGHRDPCADGLKAEAANKVVFLAARLVEISYRTQGADATDGAVSALRQLWDDSALSLAHDIAEHCPPDPDGPDIPGAGTALRPTGRVPGGDPLPCWPYPPQLGLKTPW